MLVQKVQVKLLAFCENRIGNPGQEHRRQVLILNPKYSTIPAVSVEKINSIPLSPPTVKKINSIWAKTRQHPFLKYKEVMVCPEIKYFITGNLNKNVWISVQSRCSKAINYNPLSPPFHDYCTAMDQILRLSVFCYHNLIKNLLKPNRN